MIELIVYLLKIIMVGGVIGVIWFWKCFYFVFFLNLNSGFR